MSHDCADHVVLVSHIFSDPEGEARTESYLECDVCGRVFDPADDPRPPAEVELVEEELTAESLVRGMRDLLRGRAALSVEEMRWLALAEELLG